MLSLATLNEAYFIFSQGLQKTGNKPCQFPPPQISAQIKPKQVGAVVRFLDQGSTYFPTRGQLGQKKNSMS